MKTSDSINVLVLLSCLPFIFALTTPCNLRSTDGGYVCVCNVTYCDYLDPVNPVGADDFVLVSSSKAGLRFSTRNGKFSDGTVVVEDWIDSAKLAQDKATHAKRFVKLKVDRSKEFQKIVGFGGAFTGAVSHLLDQLPTELQDAVYRSFYSQQGIAYNMMRMSIGGCDFDLEPWAYNEEPENDKELTNFNKLDPRDERKIEQLERLKVVAEIENIKIMGAAWSPPKWMKTNNAWTGFGFLKKEYYQTWADYHLRFLELMDAKNMPIWAISTGNEPMNGVVLWHWVHFMSLGWTPNKQAIWLAENLGPTIRDSKFKDVKIFNNDDQRHTFLTWLRVMNQTRKNSLDYIDGMAVHWYFDEFFEPSVIDSAHEMLPDKLILATESCAGEKPLKVRGPILGSWERGERYAHSYMQDLQHWFNGYFDWNIILDERGGPNYVHNFVDAPIVVNVTSSEEIYKQPIYYAIGHYSKFIPEGSVRIAAERTNINIVTVAFRRPDESIAAVIFNSGWAAVDVTLEDSIRGDIVISIPPRSLHTIVYN